MLKNKFMKIVFLISLCFISVFVTGSNIQSVKATASEQQNTSNTDKQVAKVDNVKIQTKEQITRTFNLSMDNEYGDVSQINEFWGTDGNYHIVYSGKNTVYISELNQQLELQRTMEIPKDLEIVGNAIQDNQGNYYIVYGKYDSTNAETDSSAGTAVVMSIVQYSKAGNQITRLTYTGNETGGNSFGTKKPFNFGNCDLLIDSTGMLICRYGRVMYNGHQSSHSLYVDTTTMTKLDYAAPYNSHSFDQKVIQTSDGGYLFADRGDAYGRGFVVSKMYKNSNQISSFIPFHFRNGYIYISLPMRRSEGLQSVRMVML